MKSNQWTQWASRMLGEGKQSPDRLKENDVVGSVSVFAYLAAANLPNTRVVNVKVGNGCRNLCKERGITVGMVRQQSGLNKRKRSLVSTYPPRIITEVLTHFGFTFEEPTLNSIERQWRPLLSIYHRLNSKN